MRALLRKECSELAVPAMLLLFLRLVQVAQLSPFDGPLGPPVELDVIPRTLVMGWILGAGLGWVQFFRERARGTHAFLIHRYTDRAGAFAAKAIAGVWIAYALCVAPEFVRALYLLAKTPDGASLHYANLRATLALGAFVVPSYAAGAFAGAFRRGRVETLSLALIGSGGATICAYLLIQLCGSYSSAPVPASLLIWTVAVFTLAWKVYRCDDDTEFASTNLHLLSACVSIVLVVVPCATVTLALRSSARNGAKLTEHGDSKLPDDDALALALRSFQPDQFNDPELASSESEISVPPLGRWAEIATFENPGASASTTVYFDSEAGCLRVIRASSESRDASEAADRTPRAPLRTELVVNNSSDGCLGPRIAHASLAAHRALVVADLDHASLWRLQLDDGTARFEPLDLPDGDQFLRIEPLYQRSSAMLGLFVRDQTFPTLWIGARARYVLSSDRFVDFDALPIDAAQTSQSTSSTAHWMRPVTASEFSAVQRWTLALTNTDPFAPSIELRDRASGAVVRAWSCDQASEREPWTHRLALASQVVATPCELLASFASHAPRDYHALTQLSPFGDPLFAGGRRGWLVGGVVLFALGAAAMVFFALRARGASRLATFAWTALVAACGLPGLLAFLTFEPRGVRRRATSTRAQATEALTSPVIQTAS